MAELLKKYKWMGPIIQKMDRETKKIFMKNFRYRDRDFFPKGEYKADIKNLANCMNCPNMCRFECGTLQAAQKETMSPAYKARIGYYLTTGKIDYNDVDFINLMYMCTNEESCKVWCPFEFSVVSLLETVRDDINDKGLMPDYCKKQIEKLKKTNTIEDHNIFETYKEKGIENIETDGNDEVFYYIGCESMKLPEVVKANIEILKKAGIKYSTNLDMKVCCGAPAFSIRDMNLLKELAGKNIELIKRTGAKVVVSDCPGCIETLTNRYADVSVKNPIKTIHIVQYISQLVTDGKIKLENPVSEELKTITIHDPCLLARNLGDTKSIRDILSKIPGLELQNPIYNKENTHCCGWSGTLHWVDEKVARKEASNRINELTETGTNNVVTACPLCELGLNHGIEISEKEKIKIFDVSKVILDSLE